ncbi:MULTISPECIES: sulfur carrier protein ThiS [Aquimarina]|uniref:Sulfur carrier protein ThiS n=2 Tax=Aquimarina algiphila TaxID=2047982 RepID=A0A554VNV8_9FLAO|nr:MULTISPECIES: sulfur carrier protein ThiS [Aquimarina]TSE10066.1 sulfur carrier protein ThiS [Aquimarina algiphila]
MMTVNVNNQNQSISENSSISALLEQLDIVAKGIAIAINNEIISKEKWNEIQVQKEDQVTIIKATQGG